MIPLLPQSDRRDILSHMRRSKQEITDKNEVIEFIKTARTARLGINREGSPYIVPMNFGYADDVFYFHCANEGLKLDLLKADPRVCIELDESSPLQTGGAGNPCSWGVDYRSVIATGTAEILEGLDEKRAGLGIILSQFVGNDAPAMSDKAVESTTVFSVIVETLTAKKSK